MTTPRYLGHPLGTYVCGLPAHTEPMQRSGPEVVGRALQREAERNHGYGAAEVMTFWFVFSCTFTFACVCVCVCVSAVVCVCARAVCVYVFMHRESFSASVCVSCAWCPWWLFCDALLILSIHIHSTISFDVLRRRVTYAHNHAAANELGVFS